MYPDLFEFLCRSQSTCHCLIYCLKKINIEALLLGTYYFMCKGAFYQLRLERVYVKRCFWVEKNLLVTSPILEKFEAFSRPFLACFFLEVQNFVKFVILAIFEVFVTWCFQVARKILVTFAPLILPDFRGPFWPFLFLSLEFF